MADYSELKIGSVAIDDYIKQRTGDAKPTKMSELTNDANFATFDDKIASATNADKAVSLTTKSGVTAGSKGPTGSVTIAANNKTGTIKIPQFTVNEQGIITSITERTLTITTGCMHCTVTPGCDQCSHCEQTSGCSQCSDCNRCNNCNDCQQYP